jgi:hypothetical protein
MTSCKPFQKIAYNTQSVEPLRVENVHFSVSIQPFEDIRAESEMNTILFESNKWNARVNGEQSCINSEVLYRVPATEQMTTTFAHHLSTKVPQIEVFINQKESADFYLTAKVKHFYGIQKFSTAAAVGAQFGLIGALATAKAKTQGTIIIELTDIKILDRQNNLIAAVGDFRKEYEGEFPVNADCLCIYWNMNQKLSEFNGELIRLLALEVQ